MESDEEDCCGSGCNNCVLDRKLKRNLEESTENCVNIFKGNYVKFSVETIKAVATSVYLITFRCKDKLHEKCILKIPPGWYLQLRCLSSAIKKETNQIFRDFTSFNDPEEFLVQLEVQERHDKDTSRDFLSRPYTPINVNPKRLSFDILFKLEKFGKMSQLITKLGLGDTVEFKGPYGESIYQPNTFRHLYLFSHGVAIAPLFSLAFSIVNDESDETFLHLVACYQNINEILLRDEVKTLQQFWNFNASIFLAHETTDIEKNALCENIQKKRLQSEDIEKIVKFRDKTSYFLICGTEKFAKGICTSLRNLLIDEDKIFVFK